MTRQYLWFVMILGVALGLVVSASAGGDTSLADTLRADLGVALAASVDTNTLSALAGSVATAHSKAKQRDLWNAGYGLGTLSSYLLFHEQFESRVFEMDPPTGKERGLALMRDCLSGRHPCDLRDVRHFSLETTWKERGVLLGTVEIARDGVYSVRARCVFFQRPTAPEDEWRLVYLGVMNRLSPKTEMSRPVYSADERWKDIGRSLKAMGIDEFEQDQ